MKLRETQQVCEEILKELTCTKIGLESFLNRDEKLKTLFRAVESCEDKGYSLQATHNLLSLFQKHKLPFNEAIFSKLKRHYLDLLKCLEDEKLTPRQEEQIETLYNKGLFQQFYNLDSKQYISVIDETLALTKQLASQKSYHCAYEILNFSLSYINLEFVDIEKRKLILSRLGTYAEKSGDTELLSDTLKRQIRLLDTLKVPFDLPCYIDATVSLFNQSICRLEQTKEQKDLDAAKGYRAKLKSKVGIYQGIGLSTMLSSMDDKLSQSLSLLDDDADKLKVGAL